jgi:hypothetical protein
VHRVGCYAHTTVSLYAFWTCTGTSLLCWHFPLILSVLVSTICYIAEHWVTLFKHCQTLCTVFLYKSHFPFHFISSTVMLYTAVACFCSPQSSLYSLLCITFSWRFILWCTSLWCVILACVMFAILLHKLITVVCIYLWSRAALCDLIAHCTGHSAVPQST